MAHFFSNPGSCSGPCRTHVLHVGFLHEPTGVETKGPLVPCMLLCTQLPRLSLLQKYEYHSSQLSLTLLASLELYWWMGQGERCSLTHRRRLIKVFTWALQIPCFLVHATHAHVLCHLQRCPLCPTRDNELYTT